MDANPFEIEIAALLAGDTKFNGKTQVIDLRSKRVSPAVVEEKVATCILLLGRCLNFYHLECCLLLVCFSKFY